jgi:hypothetical protein
MAEYHDDSVCGSCGGPLEAYRDAICTTCTADLPLSDRRYSVGTWNTEEQGYTPQLEMRNPCINVPLSGLLAALRELRNEHGYAADRGRFPLETGDITQQRYSDWSVLVERTDGIPLEEILKQWSRCI